MSFHSASFLFFFFPAVFLLHTIAPSFQWKNRLLLAAGLVFYTFGQWQGLPVLLLSAAVNYAAGLFIARGRGKKAVLILALAANLGALGLYKYIGFFTGGAVMGPLPPMGISFFTFKGISYVVDVYRGGQAAEGFGETLLYLSFFPQVTAGPIGRFGQFAPQLRRRAAGAEQAARGLRRFIVGLGKKLLLSALAATAADAAFALGEGLDIRMAWLGAVAYSIQIYFDFSGYSDMAIGLGAVFGFETAENFRYPYAACSITEFWRRWHISLSLWFRDYVYIPLGGGRRGRVRKAVNKAIVFLLCGLWHGASWTFLLWGAWHGLFSALESLGVIPSNAGTRPGRVLGRVYTLAVVCLGFVIFRSADAGQALEMLRAMFTGFHLTAASSLALARVSPAAWCALLAGAAGCLPVGPRLRAWTESLGERPRRLASACSYAGAIALFVLCLLAAAGGSFQPFIYAQF